MFTKHLLATFLMVLGSLGCATMSQQYSVTPLQAQAQIATNGQLTDIERQDAIKVLAASKEITATAALAHVATNLAHSPTERRMALGALKLRIEELAVNALMVIALDKRFEKDERVTATSALQIINFEYVGETIIMIATCQSKLYPGLPCDDLYSYDQRAIAQKVIANTVNEQTTSLLSLIAQNTRITPAERRVAQGILAQRLSTKAP